MAHADPPLHPANRLAGETSPYLLQHARNPVDWYPWGSEALARAVALDRPIMLSIGYAACHWCHVMERESFEDLDTARVLNEGFVPIKVDREERPDLDQLYMGAVQALTGRGGWPLTLFLTPDGRPFYGGTYFPPVPRHGMPAFTAVLGAVLHAWSGDRARVAQTAAAVAEALAEAPATGAAAAGLPGPSLLADAADAVVAAFDGVGGGWGRAPKFPQPMLVEFLLRRHVATGDPRLLAVARRTLDAMAAGGIRDQLGGGFHRYATDAAWLVPHFEQMLYDNAQLARAYIHAWALTGNAAYLDVATGVLDALLRDFRTPGGGFAASLDADTAGVEGLTYTWPAGEVTELLGDDAPLLEAAYGVVDAGNWEGVSILSRVTDDRVLAGQFGLPEPVVAARLANARLRLLEARALRPQPARDDKVLAAWNGLAIGALADAARAIDAGAHGIPGMAARAADYRAAAVAAATDVLGGLRVAPGRLRRSWKDGRAAADGVLEDYADLAEGLLALFEATGEDRWYSEAVALADAMLERFGDPTGGFFDTAVDAEALVVRPKDAQDNAVPSGGAMAAAVLLKLAALTGEPSYQAAAERSIGSVSVLMARFPMAAGQWLGVLEAAHHGLAEVAITGDAQDEATARLVRATNRGYHPFRVLAFGGSPATSTVPLLRDRFMLNGRPTAFVCRNFACRQPVHEPEALDALLAGT